MNLKTLKCLVLLLSIALLGSCGSKINDPQFDQDQREQNSCIGINKNGVATFLKFSKADSPLGKTNLTMSWTGTDGTVYDTRKYVLQTADQCLADEHLTEGSTTAVRAWVQCPTAPKAAESVQLLASAPYGFYFPNLKSQFCQWTYQTE